MNDDEMLEKVFWLKGKAAEDAKRNAKNMATFWDIVKENDVKECSKPVGGLLLSVASKYPKKTPIFCRSVLVKHILCGDITAGKKFDSALNYLKKVLKEDQFDEEAMCAAAGVGIECSEEEVKEFVSNLIKDNDGTLEKERYRAVGKLRGKIASHPRISFADGKLVNAVFQEALEARLGKRSDPKNQMEKSKNDKGKKGEKKGKEKKEDDEVSRFLDDENFGDSLPDAIRYPPPSENVQKTPELLADHLNHLKKINANVITRFPPEPNGYLHLGHAKSINLNFGYAKKMGGLCYLRYDDTNPASEKHEYIDSILASVRWLGYEPDAINYSSDYFDRLYELAEDLTKRGKTYVCTCSVDVLRDLRYKGLPCEHRDYSVEYNLKVFREMRDGKHPEGAVVLRMKADITSGNTALRDMIAYRIKKEEHPRTGDKWKIYPSYDFTHCLCDSIENVTHSLCTREFYIRRPAYEWLCESLELYTPPQREFNRLNVRGTVLSKRRLLKLVQGGFVRGWDDPRLFTLDALRRRGFPPKAILTFCNILSVTKNEGASLDTALLDLCCRRVLDRDCVRAMVVLKPLKLTLKNWSEDDSTTLSAPNHPQKESLGTHTISLSRVVYIEKTDFRLQDSKDYKRLAPGKVVRLRYGPCIKCVNVIKDDNGEVVELEGEYLKEDVKPKGTIHWVSSPVGKKPLEVEVRLYDRLFNSDNPAGLEDENAFLKDIRPDSLTIIPAAYTDPHHLAGFKPGQSAQFERHGYFTVDVDSSEEKLVFNRTVALKDTYNK